jgi:hypothetical protein
VKKAIFVDRCFAGEIGESWTGKTGEKCFGEKAFREAIAWAEALFANRGRPAEAG